MEQGRALITYAQLWTVSLIDFYPRDAMLVRVLAVIVCLSVCLSHAGIVSKRLNVGSRKQRHVIAQGL